MSFFFLAHPVYIVASNNWLVILLLNDIGDTHHCKIVKL